MEQVPTQSATPKRGAPKALFTVSERAAEQVQRLLESRGKPSAGIRVGIKTRGCSGLSYTIEYADEENGFDEVVEAAGTKIMIDPKAVMFLIGTEMDYVQETFKSGFVFNNPNEKGRCGCGESFHV